MTSRRPPRYLRPVFDRLDPFELIFVRRQVRLGSYRVVSRVTTGMTTLGNGWIYPLIALLLVATYGRKVWRVELLAIISAAIGHAIYPLLKIYIARPRPSTKDEA